MKCYKLLFCFLGFIVGKYQLALACDLCAIYTADQAKGGATEGLTLAVAEQFTSFNRLQNDGKHVENEGNQSLKSSITQVVGKYNFSEIFAVQANFPLISRDYKRAEDGVIKSGSESGLGDAALLALYTPYHCNEGDFFFRLGVRAGLKFPTGDTDRLKEETQDHGHMEEAEEETTGHHSGKYSSPASFFHAGPAHGDKGLESGVHGHDLTLGSGSLDYVIGSSLFIEKGRWFSDVNIQYIFRTEGDFDYRFQNDLMWEIGAGSYLLLQDERTLSLKANLSGEYKGMDVVDGNKATDTGINSMFLGPMLSYTEGANLLIQLGADLPLFVDNTDLQIVPDYRIRASISYRF